MPRGIFPQPDRALAAILDGANTSSDVADILNASGPHARVVVNRLVKEGLIRWTGRRMLREGCAGWGKRVYEAVQHGGVGHGEEKRSLDTGEGTTAP